jgi:hypothetical protein
MKSTPRRITETAKRVTDTQVERKKRTSTAETPKKTRKEIPIQIIWWSANVVSPEKACMVIRPAARIGRIARKIHQSIPRFPSLSAKL